MCHQEARLAGQSTADHVLENGFADVCIEGGEWIVKNDNVATKVETASDIASLSLTARERDAYRRSDLCLHGNRISHLSLLPLSGLRSAACRDLLPSKSP